MSHIPKFGDASKSPAADAESLAGDAVSPAGGVASPAEDAVTSPNCGICDTAVIYWE
jgi:hypothetical protein